MSNANYINKLASKTDRVIEDTTHLNEEFKKHKFLFNLFPKYNDNSIGYKVKYTFEIDHELRNDIYLTAFQIIVNYILENEIQKNEMTYFQYSFYVFRGNLRLSLFHPNLKYLESISDNLISVISSKFDQISLKVRSKFIEISSTPLRLKIKTLHKEFPQLIDVCCNIITEKKLLNKSELVIDGIIKILFMNDYTINKESEIRLTTLKSDEDPVTFLSQFNGVENRYEEKKSVKIREVEPLVKNDKKVLAPSSLFNQMENINDNIKQLFWHSLESTKVKKDKSVWIHSIIFVFILALFYSSAPKFMQKILNFSKSNSVIDNILDLATEDLTATATATVNNNTINTQNKKLGKLDTILENTENTESSVKAEKENKQANHKEDEDIGLITRNIIKQFTEPNNNNNNLELNSIENRLKVILEETDTKS